MGRIFTRAPLADLPVPASKRPCDPGRTAGERLHRLELEPAADGRVTLARLATGDAGLQRVLDRAGRVVGRNIPLLIQGESGVGKELLAQACHNSGPRADGPFVALNCAAIPESLIEAELFGYVGGAFTGARREGAVGRIQQADGGTLFLDEIGDMSLSMQARLLRVLQERRVVPVGAREALPVDIALVSATHRTLNESVKNGLFREDLYYRINGLTVHLPPLRARTDMRVIVGLLIEAECAGRPCDGVSVSEEVMHFFEAYAWPGNIRQLQNVLRVALALLDDDERVILPRHLPEEIFDAEAVPVFVTSRAGAESRRMLSVAARPRGRPPLGLDESLIQRALAEHGGNVSAAARALGIARNTLYRKLGRNF